MRTPILGKKTIFKISGAALCMIVAFACGWLVSQVQNVNKVPPTKVWTDQWVDGVMLLTGGGHRTTLISPKDTQLLIGSNFNSSSLTLGLIYDGLSAARKQQLRFYIPAAKAIAMAQQGPGAFQDRRGVLALVNCMQSVQSHGGSVRQCMGARTHQSPTAAGVHRP